MERNSLEYHKVWSCQWDGKFDTIVSIQGKKWQFIKISFTKFEHPSNSNSSSWWRIEASNSKCQIRPSFGKRKLWKCALWNLEWGTNCSQGNSYLFCGPPPPPSLSFKRHAFIHYSFHSTAVGNFVPVLLQVRELRVGFWTGFGMLFPKNNWFFKTWEEWKPVFWWREHDIRLLHFCHYQEFFIMTMRGSRSELRIDFELDIAHRCRNQTFLKTSCPNAHTGYYFIIWENLHKFFASLDFASNLTKSKILSFSVQVIQHMATEAERQARDEQLEAILGLKMLHPNIVRTFQFATKDRSVRFFFLSFFSLKFVLFVYLACKVKN